MSKCKVEHISAQGVHRSAHYGQAVCVSGNCKTIYIGGQNATDEAGRVVGGDTAAQTRQIIANVARILDAAGAGFKDIIKVTVYLTPAADMRAGAEASAEMMAAMDNPALVTVVQVAGLANPAFLVEMEAIAVVDGGEQG